MDVTNLFESEDAERARVLQHKRAFQSYKKLEFLKAGITESTSAAATPSTQHDVFEPFNYPGL